MKKLIHTLVCLFLFVQLGVSNTPSINCPSNITMDAIMGACGQTVTFDVTSGGTCPGEVINQTAGLPSGATFPVGTTINTFTVTDDNGNSSECSFEVIVIDNQDPVLVCRPDTTVILPQSTCEVVVEYGLPSFISDNCNVNPIVLQHNNSDMVSSSFTCDSMSISSHLRVFKLSDFGVPSSVQITSVDVGIGFTPNNASLTVNLYTLEGDLTYDNMTLIATKTLDVPNLFNSILNVPFGVTVSGGSTLVAELVVPDFSSGNTVPGYNFGLGQSAPSYIFSSSCGQTNPVDLASLGEPDFSLVLMVNTSNVVLEQTSGIASGGVFPVGTTTNTFMLTDASGNSATCSFNVNVIDQQIPLLVCPTNLEVTADAGACGAVVEFDVFSVENCMNETINIVAGLPSGAFFPVGNTLNVFAINDGSGNVDTCRFDVKVIDNEAPNIICANDIVQTVMGGSCSAVVNYSISAEDNCSDFTLQQISGLPSGFEFPVGSVINTFVATDASGLKDTCSFTVTIVDDTLPELVFCPEDLSVSTDAGTCNAVVNYDMPMFSDDCSIVNYKLKHNLSDNVTSSYGCTDGGASSHIRVFNLNTMGVAGAMEVDSVKVGIGFSEGGEEVTMNLYLLTGALTYDNLVLLASETASMPNIFNGTFTFPIYTPVQGGATLVAELVIPTGTNAPFIAGYNEGGEISPTYYAADNCNIAQPIELSSIGISNIGLVLEVFGRGQASSSVSQVSGLPSGSTFPMGTTSNVFEVMDAQGNVESCAFDVIVMDGVAPEFQDCQESISVMTSAMSCDTMVMLNIPSAIDNCSNTVNITNDYTNTDDASAVYPAGITLVTWTATDEAGNSNTCQTMVEIIASGLMGDLSVTDNIDCLGNSPNGSASINITTGAEPLTYLWSNQETTPTINGLIGGVYTVTVTDASGCQFIGDVVVGEAPLLQIVDAIASNATAGQADGSIDLVLEGGTPPYTFEWTNSEMTEDLIDIPAGIYGVTITDANACTAILTDIIVDEMVNTLEPELVESILFAPNPTSGKVYFDIRLNQVSNVKIQVFNGLGQAIATNNLGNQLNYRTTFDTSDWTKGIYFVQFVLGDKEVVSKRLVVQ